MALANCEGLRRAGSCAPEGEESQMLASTSTAHHTHQGMQISWRSPMDGEHRKEAEMS